MTEDDPVCGTCEGYGVVMGEVCYNCGGSGRLGKKKKKKK
jgi:DnaJ-class molecular chaperone